MTERTPHGEAEREAAGATAPPAEHAWAAVTARSRAHDDAFVFAVTTTGIYCRPSCPARRPRREHVRFFGTPAQAEQEGFRPCRRCRPRSPFSTPAEEAAERARSYLEEHLDEQVTLEALGRTVGVSPAHLQRTFKRRYGCSPKVYQDARRMERFKEEVRGGRTVLEAAFEAGFGSSRSLYERAGPQLGMTPGAYRRGGEGERIRYTTFPSPLGRVLLAATDRGVCAASLGAEEAELVAELAREFPGARLERAETELAPWARAVAAHLEGTEPHPDVPLDLEGTAFQRRVWQALREIPYGETRSYADVAEAIGRPTAARAVARACATNRVALLVPCHRVVPQSGGEGGYRWDPARKRQLLALERGG